MRTMLLTAVLSVAAAAARAETPPLTPALQAVEVSVVRGSNRYLQFDLTVPADLEAVWQALTDSDELASWAGPDAYVELRRGGAWDVYFNPSAPKGQRGSENTLLAVAPRRMLIIEAGAPAQFPTVKSEKTLAVFEVASVDAQHTHVRMTQTGWKDGAEWDAAFDYLAAGNREWLSWLYERFTTGPKQWPTAPTSTGR